MAWRRCKLPQLPVKRRRSTVCTTFGWFGYISRRRRINLKHDKWRSRPQGRRVLLCKNYYHLLHGCLSPLAEQAVPGHTSRVADN